MDVNHWFDGSAERRVRTWANAPTVLEETEI
jgi:hypothetical protein